MYGHMTRKSIGLRLCKLLKRRYHCNFAHVNDITLEKPLMLTLQEIYLSAMENSMRTAASSDAHRTTNP